MPVFSNDQKLYGGPLPKCMEKAEKASLIISEYRGYAPTQRGDSLGLKAFILETLRAAGEELKKHHLQRYDRVNQRDRRLDKDLKIPYEEAENIAKKFKAQGFEPISTELAEIKRQVDLALVSYRTYWSTYSPSKQYSGKAPAKPPPTFASEYAAGPSVVLTQNVNAIKASYAYHIHQKFAFAVGYRDLCTIKAMASGHVPTAKQFAEIMTIGSSFLRVLGENVDDF